jgi:putative membrane protein
MGFLLRILITAAGLWLADELVSGISFDVPRTMLLSAVLLGVVNAVVRPIAVFLTLPITVLTLGLFLWVINAAMLGLVAWFFAGFSIENFGSALLGSVILSFTSWLGSAFIGPSGRYEVIARSDRRRDG